MADLAPTASPAPPGVRVRVLVLIDALGEGGTERSMAELMRVLRPRGVEFVVATLRTRGAEGVEPGLRRDGFDIRLLPTGAARRRAFRALVDEVRPDVVHAMLFESNLTARRALGRRRRGRVPLLTSLVNTSYGAARVAAAGRNRWKLRVVQAVDAISGWYAVDHFHAVSEAVRDDARAHLGVRAHRLTVVPRGRPDPRPSLPAGTGAAVRRELGIAPTDRVVVNVGRHEPQKDHVALVRAMAPVLARHPDVWVLVAGRDGTATPALRRAREEVPDRDRILLLGHRADVPAVLAAADLFAMTSHYEGMPGAVIEAMAASLPVVATAIPPVAEVVTADTAVTVAVGDVAGFTDAILGLLDDPARRAAMGAAGRARFEAHFGIDGAAEGMAELYRRVAGV